MANAPLLEPADNALIGAAVVAYGYLEHELIRAAIGVSGGPKQISDADMEKIENLLDSGAALKGRLELFCKMAKKHGALSKEQIKDINDNMELGIELRNTICHGLWQRTSHGRLRVTFYNKGCAANAPIVREFSQDDICGIAQVSFECAKELSELAPFPQEA